MHRATIGAACPSGALAVHSDGHQSLALVAIGCSSAYPGGQHRVQQVGIHPEHDPPDPGRRRRTSAGSEPSAQVIIQVSDPFGDRAIRPGAADHRRERQPQHGVQFEATALPAPRVRQDRQHLNQVAQPLTAHIGDRSGSLIAAVPGLAGIYIGPNDLALSTGFGRATYRTEPKITAMLDRIIAACDTNGIVAGLHCDSVEMAQHWSARGATMLTCATDTALLEGGLRDELARTAVAFSAEGGSSTASADVAAAPSER